MRTQPVKVQKDSDNKLSIDVRPEWTQISLGRDLTTTACVIAGRILVTRTCGFVTTENAKGYCRFIKKVIVEGLGPSQPFVYVTEWSDFKGGSVGARWQAWNFIQSLTHLRALLFCDASALMRMSIKLTQRVAPTEHDIIFCPDLDQGIHIAGKRLGLALPDYFELPAAFMDHEDSRASLGDQMALLSDSIVTKAPAVYQHGLSSGQSVVFKRIGSSILFCHFKSKMNRKPIATADILKARRKGLSMCLPGQSTHIEIWDCTNFSILFRRRDIRQLLKTLFRDGLPLTGCYFLDIGCQIRSLVRWCGWRHHPAYPVQCLASLTMTILKAQEQLQAEGFLMAPPSPTIVTRPTWQYSGKDLFVENKIVDQDIIHSIGSGYLRARHLRQIFAIHRQMALEIFSAGRAYYILGGTEVLQGGSYKARKRFLGAARRLYRDLPFQMYVFYGAQAKVRAAISLARHAAPFRISLADDYDSALALIRADKMRRAYLEAPQPDQEQMVLPPTAATALQPGVDSILRYLGSISWDPDSKIHPKPPLASNHPLLEIFDAIDLINDDLKTIYQERQKAAQEQIQLQQQLARSRKMEALGLLAGGVAHDLNNVLSGIVAYPDVLLMELPKTSPLRAQIKSIRASGEQAAAIVQDLLTMSRRGVKAARPLSVNDLIQDYLNSPEHRTTARRHPAVTIQTDLAVDLQNINASPMHIKQTIMNLVLNAIEASDPTGVISIVTQNKSAQLPIQGYETIPPGEYVTLQVMDQGIGIAQEDLEHIFEPFYTKKKMGRSGTGLGMAIVWGTVQDSHGFIDLQSTVGDGTRFTLYFPVTHDALPVDSEAAPAKHHQGHGESILVVDDELPQREIATAILGRLGYRVTVVDGGEAALAFLNNERADLVVVDMIMEPDIDGLETIRRIKHYHPDQKTIICTGYAQDQRVQEALTHCCAPIVNKPYSMQTLGNAVFYAIHGETDSTNPI